MLPLIKSIRSFINRLNAFGIPLPMLRIDGKPTFTGTMVFLSFNTALLGQLGKIAGFLGGVNTEQSNYLLLITLGAYLGRRMQGKDGTLLEGSELKKDQI